MKRIAIIAGLVIVILVITQCKKDKKTTNNTPPKPVLIDATKITRTDLGGVVISEDTTDWKQDTVFTLKEDALFKVLPDSIVKDAEKSVVQMFPAYPNPVGNVLSVIFKSSKPTVIQLIVVDNTLTEVESYYSYVNTGSNRVNLSFPESTYKNNTYYRLYYGFYSKNDSLYYKGHGDILISR